MCVTNHDAIYNLAARYLQKMNGAHGFDHTQRVVANAQNLARHYPTVDLLVLETAAWLHDIGRGEEANSGVSHADVSAQIATQDLPALGFQPEQVAAICTAIRDHRFSAGRTPVSLEGQLLQDADRLDALGAIGIARTFAEGGDRALYHPDDPLAVWHQPDDGHYTLDHFFTKLLRLPETMHTAEARAEGEQRLRIMHLFLSAFASELPETATGECAGGFMGMLLQKGC